MVGIDSGGYCYSNAEMDKNVTKRNEWLLKG